jgi:hypothetical protein
MINCLYTSKPILEQIYLPVNSNWLGFSNPEIRINHSPKGGFAQTQSGRRKKKLNTKTQRHEGTTGRRKAAGWW